MESDDDGDERDDEVLLLRPQEYCYLGSAELQSVNDLAEQDTTNLPDSSAPADELSYSNREGCFPAACRSPPCDIHWPRSDGYAAEVDKYDSDPSDSESQQDETPYFARYAVEQRSLEVGDDCLCLDVRDGHQWLATILKKAEKYALVHYKGWSKTCDDWVLLSSISPKPSQAVLDRLKVYNSCAKNCTTNCRPAPVLQPAVGSIAFDGQDVDRHEYRGVEVAQSTGSREKVTRWNAVFWDGDTKKELEGSPFDSPLEAAQSWSSAFASKLDSNESQNVASQMQSGRTPTLPLGSRIFMTRKDRGRQSGGIVTAFFGKGKYQVKRDDGDFTTISFPSSMISVISRPLCRNSGKGEWPDGPRGAMLSVQAACELYPSEHFLGSLGLAIAGARTLWRRCHRSGAILNECILHSKRSIDVLRNLSHALVAMSSLPSDALPESNEASSAFVSGRARNGRHRNAVRPKLNKVMSKKILFGSCEMEISQESVLSVKGISVEMLPDAEKDLLSKIKQKQDESKRPSIHAPMNGEVENAAFVAAPELNQNQRLDPITDTCPTISSFKCHESSRPCCKQSASAESLSASICDSMKSIRLNYDVDQLMRSEDLGDPDLGESKQHESVLKNSFVSDSCSLLHSANRGDIHSEAVSRDCNHVTSVGQHDKAMISVLELNSIAIGELSQQDLGGNSLCVSNGGIQSFCSQEMQSTRSGVDHNEKAALESNTDNGFFQNQENVLGEMEGASRSLSYQGTSPTATGQSAKKAIPSRSASQHAGCTTLQDTTNSCCVSKKEHECIQRGGRSHKSKLKGEVHCLHRRNMVRQAALASRRPANQGTTCESPQRRTQRNCAQEGAPSGSREQCTLERVEVRHKNDWWLAVVQRKSQGQVQVRFFMSDGRCGACEWVREDRIRPVQSDAHAESDLDMRKLIGVSELEGKRGLWAATFKSGNKTIHVGTFSSFIEAAEAYDVTALKHGCGLRLNRPHMRAEYMKRLNGEERACTEGAADQDPAGVMSAASQIVADKLEPEACLLRKQPAVLKSGHSPMQNQDDAATGCIPRSKKLRRAAHACPEKDPPLSPAERDLEPSGQARSRRGRPPKKKNHFPSAPEDASSRSSNVGCSSRVAMNQSPTEPKDSETVFAHASTSNTNSENNSDVVNQPSICTDTPQTVLREGLDKHASPGNDGAIEHANHSDALEADGCTSMSVGADVDLAVQSLGASKLSFSDGTFGKEVVLSDSGLDTPGDIAEGISEATQVGDESSQRAEPAQADVPADSDVLHVSRDETRVCAMLIAEDSVSEEERHKQDPGAASSGTESFVAGGSSQETAHPAPSSHSLSAEGSALQACACGADALGAVEASPGCFDDVLGPPLLVSANLMPHAAASSEISYRLEGQAVCAQLAANSRFPEQGFGFSGPPDQMFGLTLSEESGSLADYTSLGLDEPESCLYGQVPALRASATQHPATRTKDACLSDTDCVLTTSEATVSRSCEATSTVGESSPGLESGPRRKALSEDGGSCLDSADGSGESESTGSKKRRRVMTVKGREFFPLGGAFSRS